ncbi:MAG: hypothetical protein H7293_19480 [Candidatus Saccharibacteria bacterium]|nr:hypothetical protein [Rhodoferax sp.]
MLFTYTARAPSQLSMGGTSGPIFPSITPFFASTMSAIDHLIADPRADWFGKDALNGIELHEAVVRHTRAPCEACRHCNFL